MFDFGKNLREIREKQGLTQKEVARRMGIKAQSYGQYERNPNTPRRKTVEKLADVLGTSEETLRGFKVNNTGVETMLRLQIKTKDNPEISTSIDSLAGYLPGELLAAFIYQYTEHPLYKQIPPEKRDLLTRVLLLAYDLNFDGRRKAVELLELLQMVPEYQRQD